MTIVLINTYLGVYTVGKVSGRASVFNKILPVEEWVLCTFVDDENMFKVEDQGSRSGEGFG